jgi:peptidoglycan DL-endopeptidase CwlO
VRRSSAFRGRTVTFAKPLGLACVLVVVSLLVPCIALTAGPAGADTVGAAKARVARLLAQLDADNIRASQLAEAYDQAQIHLQQVNAQLGTAKTRLGQTGSQLAADVTRVKQMAIQSYMDGGAARQLSLLIPGSANEIAVRGTYVQAATGSDNEAIDALRAAHIELGREQVSLSSTRAQAVAAVAQLAAARAAAVRAGAAIQAAYARAVAQLGQAQLAAAQAAQVAANQARIAAQAARSRTATPTRRGLIGTISSPVSLPPPSGAAQQAIYWAQQELGKPYVYGGAGPESFDCSGLTAWAWGHAGHSLPHSSEEQYYETTHVPVADLAPGDLVFYGMPPHHVGIYVGNGEMINALHSGTNVEYDSIYMEGDLVGGGRVN